jgi:hypothetical protein
LEHHLIKELSIDHELSTPKVGNCGDGNQIIVIRSCRRGLKESQVGEKGHFLMMKRLILFGFVMGSRLRTEARTPARPVSLAPEFKGEVRTAVCNKGSLTLRNPANVHQYACRLELQPVPRNMFKVSPQE